MAEVGWSARERRFVGLAGELVRAWFKLYPWEWAAADAFGAHVPGQSDMLVLEPLWKILLFNKALLAVLWRLFPGHPNLLAASYSYCRHRLDAMTRSLSYDAERLPTEGVCVSFT